MLNDLTRKGCLMIKQCIGCGLNLQDQDPKLKGYTPKIEADYCQSCFRLRHYGDYTKVNDVTVLSEDVLSKLQQEDALFVWVVDLYHLQESQIESISRYLGDKDVILVGTKRELLPVTVSQQKIVSAVRTFLKEANMRVIAMSFVGQNGQDGKEELLDLLDFYNEHQKVIFFGATNVGKSTLINALQNKESISTSYLPGTTLEMIEIETEVGTIWDSPGIQNTTPLIDYLSIEAMGFLQPKNPIKPKTFQLSEDQAIWIGGLGFIEIVGAKSLSMTCYLPFGINVHRTKLEKGSQQYDRLQSDPLSIKDSELVRKTQPTRINKFDVVIHDVGFICFNGSMQSLATHFPKEVVISTRKAYI